MGEATNYPDRLRWCMRLDRMHHRGQLVKLLPVLLDVDVTVALDDVGVKVVLPIDGVRV